MKNYLILLICAVTMGLACSDDTLSIEKELIGEWVYERETFNLGSTFEDTDTKGIMKFNQDETGTWISDLQFDLGLSIEWDLQSDDTRIAITKIFSSGPNDPFFSTRVYNITHESDETITFTYERSFIDFETGELISSQFENIILTRI